MIEAGKFFCPVCGNVDTEAFYKVGGRTEGLRLTHRKLGGGFRVEVIDPESGKVTPDAVELISNLDRHPNGIPERITVKFAGENRTVDATRHCRFCAREKVNTKVFLNNGHCPLYVVAMMGDRTVGKTAWLDAVSYPLNSAAVNEGNYPFRLNFVNPSGRYGVSKATPEYGRGATKFLEVVNNTDNRIVAQVLLLDMAGELFLTTPQILNRLVQGYLDYPGPDAFIFMESASGSNVEAPNLDAAFQTQTIYSNARTVGAFNGKPVAWVLTHLDQMIEDESYPKQLESRGMMEIPVMSKSTFTARTSYSRHNMLDRMAIEHHVARACQPAVLLDAPGSSNHGFLVQSCTTFKDREKGLTEDRNVSMNVMDPLLWVLNQLHIFPLTEGGFC